MMSRIVTTSEPGREHRPGEEDEEDVVPGDRGERDRRADRHRRRSLSRARGRRGRRRRPRREPAVSAGTWPLPWPLPSPPSRPARSGRRPTAGSIGRSRVGVDRPARRGGPLGPVALAPDVGHLGLLVDRGQGDQVDHRVDPRRVRQLEVAAVAERVVRAGVDADPAQDAAALVDLVLLEDARLRHQGAGRARLGAAAAGHARRVVQAHVERRRDERVEADPHEVVAGRADDLGADLGAAAAVDAARRLAEDERVGVVADVVVVDAGEAVLGHAPEAGALVVLRLERLERRPVLDPEAAQVAEPDRLAGALEAAGRLGDDLLAAVRDLVLDVALVADLRAPSP